MYVNDRKRPSDGPDDLLLTELEVSKSAPAVVEEESITKWQHVLRLVQTAVFLIIWLLFTVSLLATENNVLESNIIGVLPATDRQFKLNKFAGGEKLGFLLKGPFLHDKKHTGNAAPPELTLKIVRPSSNNAETVAAKDISSEWKLELSVASDFDKEEIVEETNIFTLSDTQSPISLNLRSNVKDTVTVETKIDYTPMNKQLGIVYGSLVLVFLYVLIVFELINRTIASILASTLSLGALAALGMPPSLLTIIDWIDIETLLLLFAMMILVGILSESGLFDFMTVYAYQITKGRVWPLINTLCFFTASLSTFMDSVTMMLLVTPITIRLCEINELNPVPVLICMVIFSNVGAAMTPVGDPPNVIITTNHYISSQGLNFIKFVIHMLPPVVMAIFQSYIQLRYMIYRDMSKLKFSKPLEEEELRHEIEAWNRAAATIEPISKDEEIMQQGLINKANTLKKHLASVRR